MSRVLLAFDDIIHGSASVYSSALMELNLADGEAYALQCVVEGIDAVETTTVQLETSGDGRNWMNKSPSPEIDQQSTPAGATTALVGYDSGAHPSLALLRVRVSLFTAGGSTPSARVRVYVRPTPADYVNPARLPGCMLWLRADQGVAPGVGGVVSAWADLSGNGRDAVQGTVGLQPTYIDASSTFNGLPALHFNGANVIATGAFAMGAYTVFMVTSGQNGTNGYFWTRSSAGVEVDTLYGSVGHTTYVNRSGVVSGYNHIMNWGQWGPTTPAVLVQRYDGTHAGHTVRRNRTFIATTNSSAGEPGAGTTNDAFVIAGRNDAAVTAAIDVAEVAVFSGALPDPQLLALEEYARRRYRLY